MRVAVIGGGILGASAAWHLAQGGAAVTVFAAPGGGATEGSFAWINASWGNDAAYRRLRMASMALWPGLAKVVPGTGYRRCGGLLWDLPEPELRAYAAEAAAQGYALRLLDRSEAARREPALVTPPDFALLAENEGMVEPDAAKALLTASGAQILRRAVRLTEVQGRAAVEADGVQRFDAVVLAAGVASAALLAPLGLTLAMRAPLGMLAHTRPLPPLLTGLILSPEFHLRQTHEGRLVIGEDYLGADPGADPEAAGRALVARVASNLRTPGLALAHTTLAARPTPGDGLPAVGELALPGLWLALSHSGMTLAPGLGAMLAREVLTGARDPLLAPYHPARLVQSA